MRFSVGRGVRLITVVGCPTDDAVGDIVTACGRATFVGDIVGDGVPVPQATTANNRITAMNPIFNLIRKFPSAIPGCVSVSLHYRAKSVNLF